MNCITFIKLFSVVLGTGLGNVMFGNSEFPVPENLKENVKFWKKIYTEVPSTKGLLHDRQYPSIIYDTITVGTLTGKKLEAFVDIHRKKIVQILGKIKDGKIQLPGSEEYAVAEKFRNAPSGAFEMAETRIRFQLGQRDFFLEGMNRSGAYIDTIKVILRKRNIPEELAILPLVESSFNVEAYSKAGASGIWQFMPETAKRYLRIDALIDERNDPILSTVAAAELLAKNHLKLKSWPLAITAYNYGLSGILRAVQSTKSHDLGDIISKYQSPLFKFASKNFYSCFLAAIEIMREPQRYFDEYSYCKKIEIFDVTINSPLKVEEICKIFGYSKDEFIMLNPFFRPNVLRKGITIPAGTVIRIGKNWYGQKFIDRVYAYYDSCKTTTLHSPIVNSALPKLMIEKIESGTDSFNQIHYICSAIEFIDTDTALIDILSEENVGLFAEWLGISASEIIQINKLEKKVPVHCGQKIKIPLKTANVSQFISARLHYHQRIQNRFFQKYQICGIETRVLKNGEKIWNFCKGEIQIPIWLLKHLNHKIDLNRLSTGTKIKVPIIIKKK